MRVFVAGTTGVMGRLVPQLVARGHQVTEARPDRLRTEGTDHLLAAAEATDNKDMGAGIEQAWFRFYPPNRL